MLFIEFIIASTLEFFSFFLFAMVLFRFSPKQYVVQFTVASLIFALVSNTLQLESLQNVSPLINLFLFVFLITIILRVILIHSIIMVVFSFVVFSLVQWLLLTIYLELGVFKEIIPYTSNGYILQITTAFVLGIISLFIYKSNGGFSYIKSSSRFFKETIKGNRLFFLILIIAMCVLLFVNGIYLSSTKLPYYVYTISIIIIIILVILIYFSIRKDGSEE